MRLLYLNLSKFMHCDSHYIIPRSICFATKGGGGCKMNSTIHRVAHFQSLRQSADVCL